MASTSIIFDLIGRDRASSEFDKVSKSAQRSGDQIGKLDKLSRLAVRSVALVGVAGAGALGKMAQAAAEDEASQKRLSRALKNAAGASRGQIAATEDWITAQGKSLGVADDDLRPALVRLVGATKDVGKAQKLASLALDVSAGTGQSLEAVTKALTKAQNGQVAGLSRLGVSTKDANGKTVSFEEAQRRLSKLHSGQATDAANTLQGKMGRLKLALSEAGESVGATLLPPLTSLAERAAPKVVAAVEDMVGWFEDNQDAIKSTATELKNALVPALETAGDVVKGVAGFFKSLPGPVRDLGIQAGLAAIALPRLTSAVGGVTSGIGGFASGVRDAETRTAALSSAARSAAGVGGMLALAKGANDTSTALGGIATVAGGALMGFSLGGPWGAAIGAGAGVIGLLATRTNEAKTAADNSKSSWRTYAGTMDRVTGAVTTATKEMIIQDAQQSGLLSSAQKLGITRQTLVDGLYGEQGARQQLVAAMGNEQAEIDRLKEKYAGLNASKLDRAANLEQITALDAEIKKREGVVGSIQAEMGEIAKASARTAELSALTLNLPTGVVTKFQAVGVGDVTRNIANLAAEYRLTPKQIKTVIQQTGADTSKRAVMELRDQLIATDKVKPSSAWTNAFLGGITNLKTGTKGAANEVNTVLGRIGSNAPKVDQGAFGKGLRSDLDSLKKSAGTKGNGVGNNLGAGLYVGAAQWTAPIARLAAQIVTNAVNAAKAAGDVRSPSRKMMYVGRMMGEGMSVGLDTKGAKISKSAKALISKTVEQAKAQIEAFKARMQTIIDLRNEVRDSAASSSNLFSKTTADDGTQFGIGTMIQNAQNQARQLSDFVTKIKALREQGLDKTLLKQLIDKGVAGGGLGDANAILSGGAGAIGSLNASQAQVNAAATDLGDQASLAEFGMTGAQAAAAKNAVGVGKAGNRYVVNLQGFVVGNEKEVALQIEKAFIRAARSIGRPIKTS